jgi:hypothetical protein
MNKEYSKLAENVEKLNKVSTEKIAIVNKINNVKAKEKKAIDATSVEYQKEAIKKRENIKLSQTLAREQLGLTGAYQKLTAKLHSMRQEYQNVAATYGVNSREAKKLLTPIQQLDNKLKKIDSNVGKFQRSVGNYGKAFGAFGKILAAAGITMGLAGIVSGIRYVTKTSADFNKNISKVQAISNATAADMAALRNQARDLGATTEKTASEVAGLQIELAKLGYTAKQIKESTGAILDFSTASDYSLADSAKLVATTLKAFGEEADQARRFTDVMAKSFSSSALDATTFGTSISIVAPAAAVAGKSIEYTTAMLGVLADRGMDASISGTSLRNMFMETAKYGISLEEALDRVRESTNQNKTAFELFGKRGATASIILANNAKDIERLTAVLENSTGATKKMADTMRNNLRGDLYVAQSAIQEATLAIGDLSDGILRGAVKGFTKFIQVLSGTTDKVRDAKNEYDSQNAILVQAQTEVSALVERYKDLKENSDPQSQIELQEVIKEITQILPQAATKFDAYGNAIEISTEKINEAIQAQRLLVLELKGVTIEKVVDEIGNLVNEYNKLEKSQLQGKRQLTFWEKVLYSISASQAKTSKDISNSMQIVEEGTSATTGELIKQNAQMKINTEKIKEYVLNLREVGLSISDVQALFADEKLTHAQLNRINTIIQSVYKEATTAEKTAEVIKNIRKKSDEELREIENGKDKYLAEMATKEITRRERVKGALINEEEDKAEKEKNIAFKTSIEIKKILADLYLTGEELIRENAEIELEVLKQKYDESIKEYVNNKEMLKLLEEKYHVDYLLLLKKRDDDVIAYKKNYFKRLQDQEQKSLKDSNQFVVDAIKAQGLILDFVSKNLENQKKKWAEEEKIYQERMQAVGELIDGFSSLGSAIAANIKDERERIIVEQRVTQIQLALTKALAIAEIMLDSGGDVYTKAIRIAANLATVIAGFIQAEAAINQAHAYEHGTTFHTGGDAVVAEGKKNGQYKPEVVLAGGKRYLFDQPTLLKDLPVGAAVKPLQEWSSNIAMDPQYNVMTEASALEIINQLKALNAKAVVTIDVGDNVYKYLDKGGAFTKIINSRFSH